MNLDAVVPSCMSMVWFVSALCLCIVVPRYLRELPEPLLTDAKFNTVLGASAGKPGCSAASHVLLQPTRHTRRRVVPVFGCQRRSPSYIVFLALGLHSVLAEQRGGVDGAAANAAGRAVRKCPPSQIPVVSFIHFCMFAHFCMHTHSFNCCSVTSLTQFSTDGNATAFRGSWLLCCSAFLADVAKKADVNKMTEKNLAVVFAPAFMQPPVSLLLLWRLLWAACSFC